MSKSLKLVIFDCDGTIVDSQHMIVAAMTQAYGWHGMDVPPRETMLSIVGL
jgi:phosphoglycolate phosphatase